MHYRDNEGNWRTICTKLEPLGSGGVYAANKQPVPVSINAKSGAASIGKLYEGFSFDNGLELVYERPDGSQLSLGQANWTNYTAGDDGVYVTNAWPGVDIEIYVIRGAVKTNFFINRPMPEYADGALLLRDHLQIDKGLSLYSAGGDVYAGNLEIRDAAGNAKFVVSAATVFEKKSLQNTLQVVNYRINGNTLDITVPGNFLNRPAASYPVVVDPLVSTATSSTVTGSSYSPFWTVGCAYLNPATVPANVTVTDIQFAFTYITSGGAFLYDGASDFDLGACRSPTGATGIGGFYWYCNRSGALAPAKPGAQPTLYILTCPVAYHRLPVHRTILISR